MGFTNRYRNDLPMGAVQDAFDALYAQLQGLARAEAGRTIPVGAVIEMVSGSVPPGFLRCDGSEVRRADYPDLFTAIGTTFGAGDGSTTFKLPPNTATAPFVLIMCASSSL